MKTRPCEACGRPTTFTCNGAPACPNSLCGSAVLAQLEADSRELEGMPFLAAHACLDAEMEFAGLLLAHNPGETFVVGNDECDREMAALLDG
jgi:hypothetical protein